MGLCAARALLKKNISVQLFEQFEIPNSKGSSSDNHRLIRYPYGAQQGYMLMVREAYYAWDDLWQDLGRAFYTQTGTLVISPQTDGMGYGFI